MAEPISTALIAKSSLSIASAGFKLVSSSAIKKLKNRRSIPFPRTNEMREIADWYEDQLVAALGTDNFPDTLANYLSSRDFLVFVQHTFVYTFSGQNHESSKELFQQLTNGASTYGYTDTEILRTIYAVLCQLSLTIADRAGVSEKDQTEESAASSAVIISTNLLRSIDENIRALTQSDVTTEIAAPELVRKYRRAVEAKFGRIQPQSFDGSASFRINDLYVVPNLQWASDGAGRAPRLSLEEMVSRPRVVVLGDPGGGKTTLSSKVAFDLATGSSAIGNVSGDIIPFTVILRDFGTHLKANNSSIVEYIAATSSSVYQVKLEPNEIEYLLRSGRIYLIFDGLDELLDTSYRKEIANTIDIFATLYPTCSILVTSRTVGYAHNNLNPDVFDTLKLGHFSANQVEKYVNNWFRLMSQTGSLAERELAAKNFLEESSHTGDIRSNPLMLGLMCTIYRSESYIPRNRPDVYEKCSRMLFRTWDMSRGIGDPLGFEAHIDNALAFLAYTIYHNASLQSGITERDLTNIAADYFNQWAFSERTEAIAAASEFIGLCKGRAWVLAEAGLSSDGENLFTFTHRTFLEYFTAVHMWRISDGIRELCENLTPRIAAGELDVVAELALQLGAKSRQGGADIILDYLLSWSDSSAQELPSYAMSTFMARSLSFLVPSPTTIDRLVPKLVLGSIQNIGLLIENNQTLTSPEQPHLTISEELNIVPTLGRAVREARGGVRRATVKILNEAMSSTDINIELVAAMSWELPTDFGVDTNRNTAGEKVISEADEPDEIKEFKEAALARMRDKQEDWPWASIALFYEGRSSASESLSIHPTHFLCIGSPIPVSGRAYLAPLIYVVRRVVRAVFSESRAPLEDLEFDYLGTIKTSAEYIRTHPSIPLGATADTETVYLDSMLRSALTEDEAQHSKMLFALEEDQVKDLLLCLALIWDVDEYQTQITEERKSQIRALPLAGRAIWELGLARAEEPALDEEAKSVAIAEPLTAQWASRLVELAHKSAVRTSSDTDFSEGEVDVS